MKILLVNNIASFNSTLSEAFNKINDIESKYIVTSKHKYILSNENEIFISTFVSKKNPLKYFYNKLTYKKKIKKWIDWADIVYYLWDSLLGEEDLIYCQENKKKIFIEWVGSDIRNPEILIKINPYYEKVFNHGYEYQFLEKSDNKNLVIQKFAKYNASVLLSPEMQLFLPQLTFNNVYTVFQRLNINSFTSIYPSIHKMRPLVIHAPSAPIAKGSTFIIPIIERLKKEFDFDFELLTGLSRVQVLNRMKTADIFLDQLIIGGHGMASIEAMAFGKPVMCFLLPELSEFEFPTDCPIVNTNPDNLEQKLISLISNSKLRNELGIKSREYVEKYHDVDKIAPLIIDIFKK
jgi:glycosyltransferase involved in cell wall biosynthesis